MATISPREYLGIAERAQHESSEQESSLKFAQVSALVLIAESLQEIRQQLNTRNEGGRLDVLMNDACKF